MKAFRVNLLFLFCSFLLAACKLMEMVETLPSLQPTETASPAAPTFTPNPTETPAPLPTATLERGVQNPENGHWYRLFNQPRSFYTAQEYCRGMGAFLVTIGDEAENRFVYSISSQTWLGASDDRQEGVWVWVTGEPMTYANWAEGEPDNCAPPDCLPQNYLVFSEMPLQWSDALALELPFICEWEK